MSEVSGIMLTVDHVEEWQKDDVDYKEAIASARELAAVKANIQSVFRDDQQMDSSHDTSLW